MVAFPLDAFTGAAFETALRGILGAISTIVQKATVLQEKDLASLGDAAEQLHSLAEHVQSALGEKILGQHPVVVRFLHEVKGVESRVRSFLDRPSTGMGLGMYRNNALMPTLLSEVEELRRKLPTCSLNLAVLSEKRVTDAIRRLVWPRPGSGTRSETGSGTCLLRCMERPCSKNTSRVTDVSWENSISEAGESSGSGLPLDGVVGLDDHCERVIKLLLDEDDAALAENRHLRSMEGKSRCAMGGWPLIGLWGMGGVGKTTLATAVFQSPVLREHFAGGMFWALIGRRPDICRTQIALWKRLSGDERLDYSYRSYTKELWYEKLKTELKKRRVLLVLDDVWKREDVKWLEVVDQSVNSKILLTTRHADVMVDKVKEYPYYVRMLDSKHSFQLFCQHAFDGGIDAAPTEVHKIARKVADSCCGLPIALKIAGSRFRSATVEKWKDARRRMQRGLDPVRAEVQDPRITEKDARERVRDSINALDEVDKRLRGLLYDFVFFKEDKWVPLNHIVEIWAANLEIGDKVTAFTLLSFLIGRCLVDWHPTAYDLRDKIACNMYGALMKHVSHGFCGLHDVVWEVIEEDVDALQEDDGDHARIIINWHRHQLGSSVRRLGGRSVKRLLVHSMPVSVQNCAVSQLLKGKPALQLSKMEVLHLKGSLDGEVGAHGCMLGGNGDSRPLKWLRSILPRTGLSEGKLNHHALRVLDLQYLWKIPEDFSAFPNLVVFKVRSFDHCSTDDDFSLPVVYQPLPVNIGLASQLQVVEVLGFVLKIGIPISILGLRHLRELRLNSMHTPRIPKEELETDKLISGYMPFDEFTRRVLTNFKHIEEVWLPYRSPVKALGDMLPSNRRAINGMASQRGLYPHCHDLFTPSSCDSNLLIHRIENQPYQWASPEGLRLKVLSVWTESLSNFCSWDLLDTFANLEVLTLQVHDADAIRLSEDISHLRNLRHLVIIIDQGSSQKTDLGVAENPQAFPSLEVLKIWTKQPIPVPEYRANAFPKLHTMVISKLWLDDTFEMLHIWPSLCHVVVHDGYHSDERWRHPRLRRQELKITINSWGLPAAVPTKVMKMAATIARSCIWGAADPRSHRHERYMDAMTEDGGAMRAENVIAQAGKSFNLSAISPPFFVGFEGC
ncbi:hypothetical protein CBR_g45212 [Chara braunii]|uniref:NB-ARC domain-containing protein n=1 Tax=Chara braunii TaxID=69332 RepID=A0A388K3B3_CHABU|nr:hypothetical protein CBR_g45212 [Chara braunii]|eukprot:GBG64516.1 hypothetical protein CBR_g45212 [Chara braunii]